MQIDEMRKALTGPNSEKVLMQVAQSLETFLTVSGLKDNRVVQGLMAGSTPAQTLGLTRADLDALYAAGFAAMVAGDLQRAEDIYTHLILFDPLEAKHRYCMGVIAQAKGDHTAALDHLTNFLALDATNADGYLRLGETMLALGRRRDARESFEIALAEALKGNGDAHAVAEARHKLSLLSPEA